MTKFCSRSNTYYVFIFRLELKTLFQRTSRRSTAEVPEGATVSFYDRSGQLPIRYQIVPQECFWFHLVGIPADTKTVRARPRRSPRGRPYSSPSSLSPVAHRGATTLSSRSRFQNDTIVVASSTSPYRLIMCPIVVSQNMRYGSFFSAYGFPHAAHLNRSVRFALPKWGTPSSTSSATGTDCISTSSADSIVVSHDSHVCVAMVCTCDGL